MIPQKGDEILDSGLGNKPPVIPLKGDEILDISKV
jgi:hypothetical protein